MIIKELDPFQSEDKFLKAGRAAEEKMAFYLRVDFDDSKEVHVLNSVRIELEDGAVQIDHVLVHPWGMIIVESKSVTGKVQIKDDGQWIRWFNDKSSGMESPLTQATIQAKRLRKHLNRMAKPENFFDQIPIDVLVAVSDKGVILQPKNGPVDGVWKADQIVEKIQMRLSTLKQREKPILVDKHMLTIGQYLAKVHKPWAPTVANRKGAIAAIETPSLITTASEPIRTEEAGAKVCKHCGKTRLEILWGKYGYYFRCLDCGKNTAIDSRCSTCGRTEKIHKKGSDFSAECESCNTSRFFYSNTAPVSG